MGSRPEPALGSPQSAQRPSEPGFPDLLGNPLASSMGRLIEREGTSEAGHILYITVVSFELICEGTLGTKPLL